ncbi:hypothetical protein MLD38_022883 [Melastoma candidum]|uniref:Uncharacterized protein n=1 Tax=Melastoma candidum TaxID=119954 RepID=A0ACB9QJW7_9MYRT|nr:hypothetical protein MLD38_022883 [Melastoma candidum]
MDRGEPSLVPEWLKNNNGSGGSGGRQPYFSSSLRSDDHSAVKHIRSSSSANSGVTSSDRTTASYFRRNSGARGSTRLQSYGSFGSRSNRNGVHQDSIGLYDKEKLTIGIGVHKDSNHSDDFGSGLQRKFQKDELQRSKSMNGSRDEDTRRRNISGELSNGRINSPGSGTVSLARGTGKNKINKPSFEQDFPSLVSEDNRVGSEVGRVPSPGLQRQLNPTSDDWTSALVEVPTTNGSVGSSGLSSVQIAPPPQSTVAPNMAEAVAQTPARARTPPEISVNTHRLEELAIKKSKQLIPMTPTMPRSHVTISLDKSKTRMVQPLAKTPQSLSSSQPVRVGPLRSDVKSANPSKLQILKPSKDLNGVSVAGKESLGSPNGVSIPVSALSMASLAAASPAVNPGNHQSLAGLERNPAVVSTIVDKKPSLQAQSRNEFFNHLKKKSSSGNSPTCSDGHSLSTSLLEKADALSITTIAPDVKHDPSSDKPASDRVNENGVMVSITSGDDDEDYPGRVSDPTMVNGDEPFCPPNEEEAAFMRSLGWEECSGEGGGLTEEEINSFLEQRSKDNSLQSLSLQKIALQLKTSQGNCLGSS